MLNSIILELFFSLILTTIGLTVLIFTLWTLFRTPSTKSVAPIQFSPSPQVKDESIGDYIQRKIHEDAKNQGNQIPNCEPKTNGQTTTARAATATATHIEQHPYRLRDDFLSRSEFSFYKVLQLAVADHYTICPKVNLGDLFFTHGIDKRSFWNRINRKHLDFLLCDPTTMQPRLGIELDDSSHNSLKRMESDWLKDDVFKAGGLPLLRVRNRQGYDLRQLETQIQEAIAKKPAEPVPEAKPGEIPICPKCREEMVLRVSKNGYTPGNPFYGCRNYPRCRQIVTTI